MAKCGDCLYFGFCKKYIDPEETFPEVGGCHTFKSKDAFVEVVHGRWLEGKTLEKCSICGKKGFPDWKYCPNCGAKMDGGNEDV